MAAAVAPTEINSHNSKKTRSSRLPVQTETHKKLGTSLLPGSLPASCTGRLTGMSGSLLVLYCLTVAVVSSQQKRHPILCRETLFTMKGGAAHARSCHMGKTMIGAMQGVVFACGGEKTFGSHVTLVRRAIHHPPTHPSLYLALFLSSHIHKP